MCVCEVLVKKSQGSPTATEAGNDQHETLTSAGYISLSKNITASSSHTISLHEVTQHGFSDSPFTR